VQIHMPFNSKSHSILPEETDTMAKTDRHLDIRTLRVDGESSNESIHTAVKR
jgi:hypothetical protein